MRAKQHAPSRTQARGIWSAEAKLPLDAEGAACRAPTPLSHKVGEGRGVRAKQHAPPLPPDKGTTVRHEVFEAGAIFPSASVNGWARLFALTPFVPLSREAGEGERAAGRTTVRPYTPRPRSGRGAGGEGYKNAHTPARSELKRCTLISPLPQGGRGAGVRAKQHAPSRTQARGIWSAEAELPPDAEANASALHRVGALRRRGAGGEGKIWGARRAPLTITLRGWSCASRGAGTRSALG